MIDTPSSLALAPTARATKSIAAACLMVVLAGGTSSAQEVSTRVDTPLPVLILVDSIDEASARAQLSESVRLASLLGSQIGASEDLLARARARVEVNKSELSIIETEKKLAATQKREADEKSLEREKQYQEAVRTLLERAVTTQEREIELLSARREESQAAVTVHEWELAIHRSRTEGTSIQASIDAAADMPRLERRLLDALRERARRQQNVADKDRRVQEAKLDILDAQERLGEVARQVGR